MAHLTNVFRQTELTNYCLDKYKKSASTGSTSNAMLSEFFFKSSAKQFPLPFPNMPLQGFIDLYISSFSFSMLVRLCPSVNACANFFFTDQPHRARSFFLRFTHRRRIPPTTAPLTKVRTQVILLTQDHTDLFFQTHDKICFPLFLASLVVFMPMHTHICLFFWFF